MQVDVAIASTINSDIETLVGVLHTMARSLEGTVQTKVLYYNNAIGILKVNTNSAKIIIFAIGVRFVTRPRSGDVKKISIQNNVGDSIELSYVNGLGWITDTEKNEFVEVIGDEGYSFDLTDSKKIEHIFSIEDTSASAEHSAYDYGNFCILDEDDAYTFKTSSGIAVPVDASLNINGYTRVYKSGIRDYYTPFDTRVYNSGEGTAYPYYIIGYGKRNGTNVFLGMDADTVENNIRIHTGKHTSEPISVPTNGCPVIFNSDCSVLYSYNGNTVNVTWGKDIDGNDIVVSTETVEADRTIEPISATGIFKYRYTLEDSLEYKPYSKTYQLTYDFEGTTNESGSLVEEKAIVPVYAEDLISNIVIIGDTNVAAPYSEYRLDVDTDPAGPDYGYGPTAYLPIGCSPIWNNVDWVSDDGYTARVNYTCPTSCTGCNIQKTVSASLIGHTASKTVSIVKNQTTNAPIILLNTITRGYYVNGGTPPYTWTYTQPLQNCYIYCNTCVPLQTGCTLGKAPMGPVEVVANTTNIIFYGYSSCNAYCGIYTGYNTYTPVSPFTITVTDSCGRTGTKTY